MHQEFEVHILNDVGIAKAKELAQIFDRALDSVLQLCVTNVEPKLNGRELAIVRTQLETASFFAKKAMAVLPENQKRVAVSRVGGCCSTSSSS
jgi:hypothetical protein